MFQKVPRRFRGSKTKISDDAAVAQCHLVVGHVCQCYVVAYRQSVPYWGSVAPTRTSTVKRSLSHELFKRQRA